MTETLVDQKLISKHEHFLVEQMTAVSVLSPETAKL